MMGLFVVFLLSLANWLLGAAIVNTLLAASSFSLVFAKENYNAEEPRLRGSSPSSATVPPPPVEVICEPEVSDEGCREKKPNAFCQNGSDPKGGAKICRAGGSPYENGAVRKQYLFCSCESRSVSGEVLHQGRVAWRESGLGSPRRP
ncbi:unnamed protein product [Amoebophrya sp. A25]|nr:unnamed protein product [Amoebophrya sp. A25]|eukprot:GSA25T00003111001.1